MEIKINLNISPFLFLTILFSILKWFKIINWVWYWIISPLWIYCILVIILLVIFKLKGWL